MQLRTTLFTLTALTILVVSFAVSCKPKPTLVNGCDQNPGACNTVSVAKEFFLFKPGSWWVYEEEYSGARDSMYVYSYANGTDYNFDIRINSSIGGYQYHYWPEYNGQPNDKLCSKTSPVIKKCMNIKCAKFTPGNPDGFLSEGRCMFFQYNLYDSVYSNNINYPNNCIRIVDIKDQYQLGQYLFDETTVKVFEPHDHQSRDFPTYRYYSRGVGLVRKELLDTTETWNLVNYHIEP